MSMVLNKDQDDDAEVNVPRPGQRLHVARLNAKLDLAKLAAQMHLSEETLLAVEADEYDTLPSRVFVRGYYRNYARLVGLPEEEVLAELDEAWPEEGTDLTIRPVGRHIKPEVRSSHRLVRLFTWLVILGLLSLVVIWWVGYLKPKGALAPEAPSEQLEETVAEPDTLALPMPSDETAEAPAVDLPPQQPVETAPDTEPVSEAAVDDLGSDEEPEVVASPVVAVPQLFQPETEPAAPQDLAESQSESKVVLRFNDDSWVEIQDSTRTFRLFGLIKDGSVRELGGKPPYTVLLGNSTAVEISIDGKPFDQSRYNKGKVARFTLAVDSPASP